MRTAGDQWANGPPGHSQVWHLLLHWHRERQEQQCQGRSLPVILMGPKSAQVSSAVDGSAAAAWLGGALPCTSEYFHQTKGLLTSLAVKWRWHLLFMPLMPILTREISNHLPIYAVQMRSCGTSWTGCQSATRGLFYPEKPTQNRGRSSNPGPSSRVWYLQYDVFQTFLLIIQNKVITPIYSLCFQSKK